MTAYKYHISGLDCANCAAKVERAIAGMDAVGEAHIDFVNKTLTLKTDHSIEDLLPHVKNTIDRVEDGIQLIPAEERKAAEQAEEKEEKAKNERYHTSEFRYGRYQRTISFDQPVKTDESTAVYDKGVLTITIPKVQIENKEPKKLEIKEK